MEQKPTIRVVNVRVDENNRLPGPEQRATFAHRQHQRRRDDHGQQVVAAVAGRAVAMPVAIVVRKPPLKRLLEVGFRSGTRLHEGKARGRVRCEDVAEPVPSSVAKLLHLAGHVNDPATACLDSDLRTVHRASLAPWHRRFLVRAD